MNPIVKSKKYECRYDGCTASYKTISGRTYHETHVHGATNRNSWKETAKSKENENNSFVEIKEIKIMATKKPKEDKEKDMDTCGGCNEQIPVGSKFCPKCGCEFE